MAKNPRKLSLKRETLRQLDEQHLAQVAGGDLYAYAVASVGTVRSIGRCDSQADCFFYPIGNYWYF